ncbi:MAG: hypothetical protein M3N10_10690 [Actinomycetota bacterium]|nr:hypothetical protein [Actinomycetota bacterium]
MPFSLARRAARRFKGRLRRPRYAKPAPDPVLRARAAAVIREHAESHATLFERAERLRARAERLEREGTPSDSAHNRAERAEREVADELAGLRASFGATVGSREGQLAFDQEVALLYPVLKLSDAAP